MFCTNCGKELSDKALFCVECGAKIRKDANNVPDSFAESTILTIEKKVNKNVKNKTRENKEGKAKLKKKWIFWVISFCVLSMLIVCGLLLYKNSAPIRQIKKSIKDQDYKNVVFIYNSDIYENSKREKEINPLLESTIDNLVNNYFLNPNEYDKTIAFLAKLEKIHNTQISDKASYLLQAVNLQADSLELMKNGDSYFSASNPVDALKNFFSIEKNSNLYNEAQEKIIVCVDEIIKVVGIPETIEECNEKIKMLNDALDILKTNSDLMNCRTEIMRIQSILSLNKLRNDYLNSISNYVTNKDYNAALLEIANALKEFPNDTEFLEKKSSTENLMKSEYLNQAKVACISLDYTYLGDFCDGVARVRQNGKWGYIDTSWELVISLDVDYAHDFSEGLAAVGADDKWGYIDTSGKYVFKSQFDRADDFSEGLAAVKKDRKWGYIDSTGKYVIEPQFDEALEFSEGMAAVKKDSKWGYIDASGKIVIGYQFDEAYDFFDGIAKVEVYYNVTSISHSIYYGFIDKTGKYIIKPQLNWTDDVHEGLICFCRVENNKEMFGFLDIYSKQIIEPKFRGYGFFSEGLAAETQGDGKWGYIDSTGKFVIEPQFDIGCAFNEGVAAVKKDGKWGYIDSTGKFVVEPQFDEAGEFTEGLAAVAKNGKYGFIETSGKYVIEPQFDHVNNFSEGIAAVEIDGEYSFISIEGKVVVLPQFLKSWLLELPHGNKFVVEGKDGYFYLCMTIE